MTLESLHNMTSNNKVIIKAASIVQKLNKTKEYRSYRAIGESLLKPRVAQGYTGYKPAKGPNDASLRLLNIKKRS